MNEQKRYREYRLITEELIYQIDDLAKNKKIDELDNLEGFFCDGFARGIEDSRTGIYGLVEYIDILSTSLRTGEPNPYTPRLRQRILDDLKNN